MNPIQSQDNTFIDTVCHQPTLEHHLHDVDCHYDEMKKILVQIEPSCTIDFPYPKGKEFTVSTTQPPPPPIFRITDYTKKIKETKCQSIYRQYSVSEIHEAIATNHPMKPTHRIAPLTTSIQFFQTTIPIPDGVGPEPHMNDTYTYSTSQHHLTTIKNSSIPMYFNWMDHEEITRPVNQGLCGSCWAIAAATCVSDVYVVSLRIPNPDISPSYVLSCYPQSQCDGGNPVHAIYEMSKHGVCTSDCISSDWNKVNNMVDTDTLNQSIPACKCKNPSTVYFPSDYNIICIPPVLSSFSKTDAAILQSYLNQLYGSVTIKDQIDLSTVPYTDIQRIIQHHIYNYGPVIGGFHVFSNFLKGDFRETNDIYIETHAYQGVAGIDYADVENSWVGSHAVVIVGWGEDMVQGKNVAYWIVRNSWGESWGINRGLFKIAMYGTEGFQNRISQFEYPSLITTDTGYGITGGVILVKAGRIQPPEKIQTTTVYRSHLSTTTRMWILISLLVCAIIVITLFITVLKPRPMIWYIVCSFMVLLFVLFVLL